MTTTQYHQRNYLPTESYFRVQGQTSIDTLDGWAEVGLATSRLEQVVLIDGQWAAVSNTMKRSIVADRLADLFLDEVKELDERIGGFYLDGDAFAKTGNAMVASK